MKNRMIFNFLFILLLQIPGLNGHELSAIIDHCSKVENISVEGISIERFNYGVSNRAYLLSTTNEQKLLQKFLLNVH